VYRKKRKRKKNSMMVYWRKYEPWRDKMKLLKIEVSSDEEPYTKNVVRALCVHQSETLKIYLLLIGVEKIIINEVVPTLKKIFEKLQRGRETESG